MQPSDKINDYVKQVCSQIRWKRAHLQVGQELRNHIIDQRDALMHKGMSATEATDVSIIETGDAILIGSQLDKTHRPKSQGLMLITSLLLFAIGMIVSLIEPIRGPENIIFYAILGIVLLVVTYFFDFSLLAKFPKTVYCVIVILSCVMLFFGPHGWRVLGIAPYSASYSALLLPIAFSLFIFSMKDKGIKGIILFELACAVPSFVAMYTSPVVVYLFIFLSNIILLAMAIYKNWFKTKKCYGIGILATYIIAHLAGIIYLVFRYDSIMLRIESIFNPAKYADTTGYMAMLANQLLSNANLIGATPINNADLFRALLKSDMVLVWIAISFGLLVVIATLCIVAFFIIKGVSLCIKQRSNLGQFVATAVMTTFIIQVGIYLLFNLGIHSISPLSLPFISTGNMANLINFCLIGLMLSLFRSDGVLSDNYREKSHTSDLFSERQV